MNRQNTSASGTVSSRYCKHCNSPIIAYSATRLLPAYWVHANGLILCDPIKTKQPYGLEAAPRKKDK